MMRPFKGLMTPSKGLMSPSKGLMSPLKRLMSPSKRLMSPLKRLMSPSKRLMSPSKRLMSPSKRLMSPSKRLMSSQKERNALGAFLLNTNKVQGIVICLSWSNRIVRDFGWWISDFGMNYSVFDEPLAAFLIYAIIYKKFFDCRLWISDFGFYPTFRNPKSTIRNLLPVYLDVT
jgi:hypothetical protein